MIATRTIIWPASTAPADLACARCGKAIDARGGAKGFACMDLPWEAIHCSKRCLQAAREEHDDR